jgi:ribosome-binding protein aMBF1 (putative translation factor)
MDGLTIKTRRSSKEEELKTQKKTKPAKAGKAVLAHLKKHQPHLYRALKNPTPKARLGANVTDLRLKKGMTREQLAAKAKMPHHALKKIEEAHPTFNPTVKVVERLAAALGVDILDLYRFIGSVETVVR